MTRIMVRSVPRENDIRVLDWLRRRTNGETCRQIGARWGVSDQVVGKATDLILSEDLAHAGDAEKEIRAGYWRGRRA